MKNEKCINAQFIDIFQKNTNIYLDGENGFRQHIVGVREMLDPLGRVCLGRGCKKVRRRNDRWCSDGCKRKKDSVQIHRTEVNIARREARKPMKTSSTAH